ncbi:MAG: FG-GAP and VCBS repeat-containing protein [Planctomycetota bacterium]
MIQLAIRVLLTVAAGSPPSLEFTDLSLVGGTTTLEVTGTPHALGAVLLSGALLQPPVGELGIAPPYVILPLGQLPPSGEIVLELRVPHDELLIGIPYYGQAWVDAELSPVARKRIGPVTLAHPDPKPNSKFGWSVLGADLDHDGYDDLVVGAARMEVSGIVDRGQVFYSHGPDASTFKTLDAPGLSSSAWYGAALARGDLNGDGLDDLAVGAILAEVNSLTEAGMVFAFLSPNLDAVPLTEAVPEQGAHLGAPLEIADFDQDGFNDLIAAAPRGTVSGLSTAGRVQIFFGPTLAQQQTLTEPVPGTLSTFGSCTSVGDIDRDGATDLLVGAITATSAGQPFAGQAYLFYGPSAARVVTIADPTPHTDDRFGRASTIADFNGDGFDDIAISAYRASEGLREAGEAWVYMGPARFPIFHLVEPIPELVGEFGVEIASGSLDGNARRELAIGTEFASLPGGYFKSGALLLYRDGDFEHPQRLSEHEPQGGAVFGFSIAFLNLYGAGRQSIAAGAIHYDESGMFNVGRVTLFP